MRVHNGERNDGILLTDGVSVGVRVVVLVIDDQGRCVCIMVSVMRAYC